MVKSIYLTGIGACGKTLLSYGFITKFRKEGLDVTYFKPVAVSRKKVVAGRKIDVDIDVLGMKEALELEEELDLMSPYSVPERYVELSGKEEGLLVKIKEVFKRISANKDLVVIEGHKNPETLVSMGLSDPEVAKFLKSKVLLIARYEDESVIDKVLMYKNFIERRHENFLGVLFNNVPIEIFRRAKDVVTPFFEGSGVKVVGVIPEKTELTAPTVGDIASSLEADILEGEEYLDNIVEDTLCGAMSPEGALKWFRRARRTLLVTGGDRTDLILTALETKPSAIVLTGNLYPAVKALTAAMEKRVPILLVPYDTYTTIEMLGKVQCLVTARSLKVRRDITVEVVEKYVRWKELLEAVLK